MQTKKESWKAVEDQMKALDDSMLEILSAAITEDVNVFHSLPDHLRHDKDIVKMVVAKVGADKWFKSEGLTKKVS